MSIVPDITREMLKRLRSGASDEELRQRFVNTSSPPPKLRTVRAATANSVAAFWKRLRNDTSAGDADQTAIADTTTVGEAGRYSANIENFIGTIKIPVGLAGPLRVNGTHARGDFLVPLATTEAALVASYSRGAEVATLAGGVFAALASESVLRTPGFKFRSVLDAGLFCEWVAANATDLRQAAEATTSYGKLISLEPVIDSDTVFLLCRYTTGDAAGQNMVTIATDALCRRISITCPIKSLHWFVEANFSGDKKASHLGLLRGRGRKVTASVTLPPALVEQKLQTTIEQMLAYARMANLGALMTGQIGAQGHYANGLAALYIATGQDAACVSESAVGFSRMEAHPDGLMISATLPNILVGSVGGGTGLPSQSAGLNILGLKGSGKAAALAEVAASLCLAGEISIIAALAAGHFSHAHESLARKR